MVAVVVEREQLYRRKWRFYRRESSEGALRVGRSFVEKKGIEGRDGGSSIEESGGSTGESREEVRSCGGVDVQG